MWYKYSTDFLGVHHTPATSGEPIRRYFRNLRDAIRMHMVWFICETRLRWIDDAEGGVVARDSSYVEMFLVC